MGEQRCPQVIIRQWFDTDHAQRHDRDEHMAMRQEGSQPTPARGSQLRSGLGDASGVLSGRRLARSSNRKAGRRPPERTSMRAIRPLLDGDEWLV